MSSPTALESAFYRLLLFLAFCAGYSLGLIHAGQASDRAPSIEIGPEH